MNMSSDDFDAFFDTTNLDSEVVKLQVLLEEKSLPLDTEYLLQLLEQCFSTCSIELLDEKIFREVLPKAQHLLSQIVKAIDDLIGDNARLDDLDGIKCRLQVCYGLLDLWKKCVEHISALENVRATYVATLCDILPETTRTIFEHCKASPKYGALLSGAMQELRNLFAKAGEVFKLFFATLNGVIVFDTDVQTETELLTKVIDAYGNIASIANGMDSKTFVELSEAFAKLAIVHQSEIKSNNITTHLARMTKDVSCLLSNIKDQNDKSAERNIMVAMRLLRILLKLTSSYSASLTHEMMSDLIELLGQMHRYSCLTIAKGSGRTISADAASFLNIIFNRDDFKQVYFEYGRQIISRDQYVKINYQLLTIAIMMKLNGMSYEHHWSVGSDSILDVSFTYMEHIDEQLCAGDLRLPGVRGIGEGPRSVSIYEATLVIVCSLISQIPPEDFHAVELLLLKHLLSDHFWRSLLSSDVWCFIGRLGSSQLCADHIKHLVKVSAFLVQRRNSTEVIMLDSLIVRLFDLLNEDMKSTLFENLADPDMDYYTPILCSLMTKTKSLSRERLEQLNRKIEDLPKAFSDLQEHPLIHNWDRFLRILFMCTTTAVDYSDNKNIIDVLTKIWSIVEDSDIKYEGLHLDLLTDMVVVLLDATCLKSLHDDSFCAILTSVANLCSRLPPRGKIKICHFLRQNVESLGRCGVESVASTLTKLFCHLLEDEHSWVHQEALEIFEHLGQKCPEQLVAKIATALAKIPGISNVMQAYLSSRPSHVLRGFTHVQDYLRYLVEAVKNHEHRCYEYNEPEEKEREEKMPKLEEEKNPSEIIAPLLTPSPALCAEHL
ncbi:PREDICTED: uncharacterized protein C1orf112-like [Wasmannia auropunctata]|uniref:uncharacterized protein C1orf112-like n=1 Tax=Wasmannia auropunctata TaxID=64793 RepID=UPI0005F05752|nr:PREDICTED: uncharacterized protein C1orf112-like [Wasmannia auropunctata]